jgi:hypothetical protein
MPCSRTFVVRRISRDGRRYPIGKFVLQGRNGVLFLNMFETPFNVVETSGPAQDEGGEPDPQPTPA